MGTFEKDIRAGLEMAPTGHIQEQHEQSNSESNGLQSIE